MANSYRSDDLDRIGCRRHLGWYGHNRNIDTIASTADSQILMSDIFTSLYRLTTAAVVAIALVAVVSAKSPLFGLVDGSIAYLPRDRFFHITSRHSPTGFYRRSISNFRLCFSDLHDNYLISRTSQSDRAAGLAGAAYGGNVLFLADICRRIWQTSWAGMGLYVPIAISGDRYAHPNFGQSQSRAAGSIDVEWGYTFLSRLVAISTIIRILGSRRAEPQVV
jgi:hypothetical protein